MKTVIILSVSQKSDEYNNMAMQNAIFSSICHILVFLKYYRTKYVKNTYLN